MRLCSRSLLLAPVELLLPKLLCNFWTRLFGMLSRECAVCVRATCRLQLAVPPRVVCCCLLVCWLWSYTQTHLDVCCCLLVCWLWSNTQTHLDVPVVCTILQPLPFISARHMKSLGTSVQGRDGTLLLAE